MSDSNNSQGGCQQTGVIYKITCLVTGKPYVGQTRQKLERRIGQHKVKSKKATAGIDAAIRKYGWENFTVEVLEVCPIEQLDEREIFWIATLNSKAPNGYNLTDGGESTSGYSHTKETRDKISAKLTGKPSSHKGKQLSEEHKAKLSANHIDFKGKNHPFFGKHHSPETCAILSALNTGKKHTQEEIAKISASNKGKHSHNKGRKHTPEECARMSIAQKAAWARRKKLLNLKAIRDTLSRVSLMFFLEVQSWQKLIMTKTSIFRFSMEKPSPFWATEVRDTGKRKI